MFHFNAIKSHIIINRKQDSLHHRSAREENHNRRINEHFLLMNCDTTRRIKELKSYFWLFPGISRFFYAVQFSYFAIFARAVFRAHKYTKINSKTFAFVDHQSVAKGGRSNEYRCCHIVQCSCQSGVQFFLLPCAAEKKAISPTVYCRIENIFLIIFTIYNPKLWAPIILFEW